MYFKKKFLAAVFRVSSISFLVSCLTFAYAATLEIGKASSGLKEKPEEGLSYEEMTEMLKKLITEENGREVKVKPKIVVSVKFQNVQKSPTYSSGYALRFPRITRLRPDKSVRDILDVSEISI